MTHLDFLPMADYEQRHAELLKLAADWRLINQASKANQSPKKGGSKFLARLGKELSAVGFSLEVRYGSQSDAQAVIGRQRKADGCA